jgi:D-beta-D-heptose 7-phosphate kinase/D-beta-D-heptose 1-phosphate adenosyltransferase
MDIGFSSSSRVLVIGDVIMDKYLRGTVHRISPEAPVPVVKVSSQTEKLGGAGNVSHNLVSFGVATTLVGFIGRDEQADAVRRALIEFDIRDRLVDTSAQTLTKIRIVGDSQQIVRVDFETDANSYHAADYQNLLAILDEEIAAHDLVVLSDYAKGVCVSAVCESVLKTARALKKPVIVDPKGTDWNRYQGAFLVTPNLKELGEVAHKTIPNEDRSIIDVARDVRAGYGFEHLLVTRSEKGMSLVSDIEDFTLPTHAQEVFDVSGAGDTVVASLAGMLASGRPLHEAMRVANIAAGIVVAKLGTAVVSLAELNERMNSNSHRKVIQRWDTLTERLREFRETGAAIVFTNGVFDILHTGHVQYLRQAKELGAVLVVGVNADESVRRLKGPTRPINRAEDRAELLAALEFVDFVTIFSEDTPYELIRLVRPDVLVKGGDYKVEDIVGREFAGETKTINFVNGYSTTSTIARMKG